MNFYLRVKDLPEPDFRLRTPNFCVALECENSWNNHPGPSIFSFWCLLENDYFDPKKQNQQNWNGTRFAFSNGCKFGLSHTSQFLFSLKWTSNVASLRGHTVHACRSSELYVRIMMIHVFVLAVFAEQKWVIIRTYRTRALSVSSDQFKPTPCLSRTFQCNIWVQNQEHQCFINI